MKTYRDRKPASFRSIALRTMLIIVIPLFVVIAFLDIYTVRNQKELIRASRISSLSAYQTHMVRTVELADSYLETVISANLDFQSIVYANSKTDAFAASEMVAKTLKPLLQANELLGGFYTYSGTFDYYRPINTTSYPHQDAVVIHSAVMDAVETGMPISGWQPIALSDRTVLLSAAVFRNTAIAVVIDPGRLNLSGMEDGGVVFSILPDGSLYAPQKDLKRISLSGSGEVPAEFQNENGHAYDAVSLPLPDPGGHILYAVPKSSPLAQLSIMQNVLLLAALCLLTAIPIYWLAFRRLILEPLHSLTDTMHAIQGGETNIHVPQDSQIQEVNAIAGTVNTMLDTLRQQRISFYEQQLETQHAQLQYLQLQIRPHFYLNCLNMVYSLAEEKDCAAIQELVLDLSAYLRSMFRNSTKLVPLRAELDAVESYIRIQQMGAQPMPQLKLDLDAQISDAAVPPLSILTFVENSFKHSKLMDTPLEIRVKCSRISSEEGDWLNMTICDNCGGTSEEQIKQLNALSGELYREKHVGIFNVKQRLHLLYGEDAMLSFRNQAGGICVELFLPITQQEEEAVQ